MSKQAKIANLSGATVVSVGLLVWNEKEDDEGGSTTWITKKDFKEAVQAAGGKVGAAVNSRTTIVVKGNTTRGDGYEAPLKAIAEQQQAGSRKAGALKVERLASFVKDTRSTRLSSRRCSVGCRARTGPRPSRCTTSTRQALTPSPVSLGTSLVR